MQPCRVEQIDGKTYIDVCHNISGVQAVFTYLKTKHLLCNITVVCGFSKLKDTKTILEFLIKEAKAIYFVRCPHFKVQSTGKLWELASELQDSS